MKLSTKLFVVFFAALALSMPGAKSAQAQEPPKETVAQVDGITSRAIDVIWLGSDAFWHHGDYNRVISLIRICVEADPSFTEAYSDGAWLLWSMGELDAAEALIQNGVRRSPKKGEIEYEFGWVLFHYRKDYAAALPHLQAATQYPDAGPVAWSNLAHCYDRLGKIDESVEAWRQVVKRYPNWLSGPPNLHRVEEKQRKLRATPPASSNPA